MRTGFTKEEGENWDEDNQVSDGVKKRKPKPKKHTETHFNTSIMLFLT